jgi:hypothetical protein
MKTTLTWKQRVMAATTGRNSRGAFLWYSHDKICSLVSEQEGIDPHSIYRSLSAYLSGLVKSGHLERALKPPKLRQGIRGLSSIPEYVYRQTGKPFARGVPVLSSSKNLHTEAARLSIQGHELWRLHRSLPKWFRRMMMD